MEYLKNIAKGAVTGVATLVPGVSGGTMAIVLGIYDRLLHSVGSFFEDWKKNLLFLAQVAFGGVVGLLLFSRLMENAMAFMPHVMKFLFIGIIAGGLPVLCRKTAVHGNMGLSGAFFMVAGFAVVLLMTSEPGTIINMATTKGFYGFVFLLAAGAILSVAFVLPGISASFMLLALGLYELTLNAINTVNAAYLLPLGIGAAAGTVGTARLLESLLKKHPGKMYMLIIGFVAGSLVEVYPGIPGGWQLPASVAAFAAGFAAMYIMGKKGVMA